MTIYPQKYGFVYIWYDRKHKRYYVGCHWGTEDDGYICSSPWMIQAYRIRPQDFKRRIIKTNIPTREQTYAEEQKWLNLIKEEEIKPKTTTPRYYNLNVRNNEVWHKYEEKIKTVGEKISKAKTGKSVPCTPEKAVAISEAKKGKPLTAEHRAALTGIKKKAHTDEWKQQNSERFKQIWADPEFRARQTESRKAAWVKRRKSLNTSSN
jgi:hypothetical protein